MNDFEFRRESKRSRNLQELEALSAEGDIGVNTEEAQLLLRQGATPRGIGDETAEKTQRYLYKDKIYIWRAKRTDEEYPTNLRQAA